MSNTENNATIINKISTKTVCGKVEKPTKKTLLMRVFGVARQAKGIETPYGDSIEFKGDFQGINTKTGETFRSGKMFLPDVAANLLEPAVNSGEDGKPNAVEFGFDVFVTPSDKAPTGYEYSVTPLVKPSESDPLAKLAADMPALPAPAKK